MLRLVVAALIPSLLLASPWSEPIRVWTANFPNNCIIADVYDESGEPNVVRIDINQCSQSGTYSGTYFSFREVRPAQAANKANAYMLQILTLIDVESGEPYDAGWSKMLCLTTDGYNINQFPLDSGDPDNCNAGEESSAQSDASVWTIEPVGGGQFMIESVHWPGTCLAAPHNFDILHTGECSTQDKSLLWYFEPDWAPPYMDPLGSWTKAASNNGDISVSLTTGMSWEDSSTVTKTDQNSMSQKIEIGCSFMDALFGVKLDMTKSYSHSMANAVTSSQRSTSTSGCTANCHAADIPKGSIGWDLYQWELSVAASHQKTLSTKTCTFLCIPIPEGAGRNYPRCPAGCCADKYCQTCKPDCIIPPPPKQPADWCDCYESHNTSTPKGNSACQDLDNCESKGCDRDGYFLVSTAWSSTTPEPGYTCCSPCINTTSSTQNSTVTPTEPAVQPLKPPADAQPTWCECYSSYLNGSLPGDQSACQAHSDWSVCVSLGCERDGFFMVAQGWDSSNGISQGGHVCCSPCWKNDTSSLQLTSPDPSNGLRSQQLNLISDSWGGCYSTPLTPRISPVDPCSNPDWKGVHQRGATKRDTS